MYCAAIKDKPQRFPFRPGGLESFYPLVVHTLYLRNLLMYCHLPCVVYIGFSAKYTQAYSFFCYPVPSKDNPIGAQIV
jgi:hypothetical protein